MSKPMSLIIAWTYVCPSYVVSLDIRMSNLDKRMSNLTMLFNLTVSNFLTSGSFKNLTKHPESYIQSWIFGSFVLSKFQYQLGHTYVQAGHTFVQVGHTYVQVGHTYVQNNNASTDISPVSGHQTFHTSLVVPPPPDCLPLSISILTKRKAQAPGLSDKTRQVDLDLWMSILLDVGNGLEFTI